MNFQVPQFIEQEAKIVGFLTLKQFLYFAAAGIISFIAFQIFSPFFWFFITLVVGVLAIAAAFVKINGQNLPQILKSALNYFWQPRTFTWQRITPQTTLDVSEVEKIEAMRKNISVQEKLKSVALNIATGKILSAKQRQNQAGERFQVVTYVTGEKKMAKRVDY